MKQARRFAWVLILIVDLGYIAWGAMAAAMPDGLLGPGGKAILPAGYEGYSGGSWSELLRTSPMTAQYSARALPDVRHLQRGVRADGERYRCHGLPPWRSLGMVGVARRQHNRPCVGDHVRLDRERHRAVRAHRIPRPRLHFRSCRRYSALPRSGAAASIDGLTRFIPRLSDCRCSREQPHVESSCL